MNVNKKLTVIVSIIGLIVMLGDSCVYAKVKGDTVEVYVEFPEPKITPSTYMPGYSRIDMEGMPSLGEVGEPVIPVKGLKMLIPPDKKVKDMHVILGEKITLRGTYQIESGQEQGPLSKNIKPKPIKPKPEIYEKDIPYPAKSHKQVSVQRKLGYPISIVNLLPVEYYPVKGEVSYFKNMTVVIELRPEDRKVIPRRRNTKTIKERDNKDIQRFIDNTEDLMLYTQGLTGAGPTDATTGDLPEPLSGQFDPNQQYDYVIITDPVFVSAFTPLRDRRIQNGFSAAIIDTAWIYANYSGLRPDGGEDNQTKIRNFIKDAYSYWGTSYVLLGGDADGADAGGESGNNIIPIRGLDESYHSSYPDGNISADLYYACLDGDFDGNGNGKYAEPLDEGVDLLAEVYIGRAPVDSLEEVNNFVRKTLAYEDSTDAYLTKSYMLGEYLGFGGISQYATASMEEIRLGADTNGLVTQGFLSNPDRAFDADTLYDEAGEAQWPKEELIEIMNSGVHIVNHLGHSNTTHNMKLTNNTVDTLANGKYFIIYTQGCYAGSVDNRNSSGSYLSWDCIGEHFTLSSNGAVAFIGNSRYGWGALDSTNGSSQRFNRTFWSGLFGDGIMELGKLNQHSKEANLPYLYYGRNRWCYFELSLFGDPALAVNLPNSLILYPDYNFIELIGNGDDKFSPGETAELRVSLRALNQDAFNVSATLNSEDPYVIIEQNNSNYGDILKGQSGDNSSFPFRFTISDACSWGRKIGFTFITNADDYSRERQFSIEAKDATPPVGSILINGGDEYTYSTQVTLTLSADDTGSGVYWMYFSNSQPGWTEGCDYTTTRSWTLTPGYGEKTVYVIFKDVAGNFSEVYSDTIIYIEDLTIEAPTNLIANVSSGMVTLGWTDNSNNEEGFYIERGSRSKGSVTYKRIGQVGENVTTYSEIVVNGAYYRVQACSLTAGKVSGYSNEVKVNVASGNAGGGKKKP
ncbi:MAG: C25 family cysteine peptidase [Candidatus Omnitrophota bacterium]